MENPLDKMPITSDDALRNWEEEIEVAVANAIERKPLGQDPSDLHHDHEKQPDDSLAEAPDPRPTSHESYIGELLVDPATSPADTFKFCLDLKDNHKSEIISIDHSNKGTTIKCTVPNPASLLSAIYQYSGIASWALVAQ